MIGKCVEDLYSFCQEQVGWLKQMENFDEIYLIWFSHWLTPWL
jgi:hypothetical protein